MSSTIGVEHRLVDYWDGNTRMLGYLACASGATTPRPAVLIAHTWAGRGDLECTKARQLAELGYVGFAIDVYGDGMRGAGPDENARLLAPLMQDRALLQRRMNAAVQAVCAQPEADNRSIAAIGFCFGGLCVLDLARTGADIAGAVSFHGLFTPPGNTEGNIIKAKVLCLHGNDDPMVPPDAVAALGRELTAAGADWQIHVYGGAMHGFSNPAANRPEVGTQYNATADRRAWQSLLNFLAEIFPQAASARSAPANQRCKSN